MRSGWSDLALGSPDGVWGTQGGAASQRGETLKICSPPWAGGLSVCAPARKPKGQGPQLPALGRSPPDFFQEEK